MDLLAIKRSLMPLSGPQDMGGGGGGGGGQPSSTTQTQELPEWARGYAKDVLAKGAALTDIDQNKYQAYRGNRVADFGDLQKTAMGSVASPEAWGKSVQGYMSPYMENVVKQQQRGAIEQAGAQMGGLNARAAQMGAFGGSGIALQRAAQGRDLGKQLEGIQATGLQTAFQQGTQQANQALGQQMQLGALQQQQAQRGLDLGYQDFLEQKNYPYQQLSYMSNLIRGTPMGMNSQSQVYQAPGSMLGQLAGLGVGAYGLSKMAEGGEVQTYAGDRGSVTSEENVAAIADGLDDQALQQAYQNALARRDVDAIKALETEMAMRASERSGMAGAFNQLPQETQETFTAANGGIVAFSKGGTEGEYFQDPMGAPSYEVSEYSPFKQNVRMGENYTPGLLGMLFGYNVLPAEKKADAAPAAKGESYDWGAFDKATDEYMAGRSKTAASGKGQGAPSSSITAAAKQMAAKSGVPEEDFLTTFRKLRTELQAEGKEDMKALNDQIAKYSGRSKEIKERGVGKALADFGFQMAAAAAKPGEARRSGILGALESAAAASPTLAASTARTQELADAAEDNAMKMQLTMKQYEIAQRKGDTQAAAQMAQNMRMLQQAEKQLELKRAEIAQSGGYQQGMLDIHRADMARKAEADKIRGITAQAQLASASARMADVQRKAGVDFDNANGRTLRKQLEEQYGPTKAEYMYNQKRRAYIAESVQGMQDQRAEANSGVQSVYDLLGRE